MTEPGSLECWFVNNRRALYTFANVIAGDAGDPMELFDAAVDALVRKYATLDDPGAGLSYAIATMWNHRRGWFRKLRGMRFVELTSVSSPG